MDTRSKKSDKSIITKAICFILVLITVGFGALQAVGSLETMWNASATKVTLNDTLMYNSIADFETSVFRDHLDWFLHRIDSLAEFEGGSKEAYEKEANAYKTAAENLKKDIVYHIKKDMYETNKHGVTEGIAGLLELSEAGYISLDYMNIPAGEAGRYLDYKTELSYWEMEEWEYVDFFIDEPEMYYDDSWDEGHSQNASVEYYYNSLPADAKKMANEMGYDLVVPINALVYEDDVDETVMHTTVVNVTNVDGELEFYGNDTSYFFGFYGVTIKEEKLQDELYAFQNELYISAYSSYEDFLYKYEEAKEQLKTFPSAYFATVKDGKVVSTNIKGITSASTKAEIEKALSKCDFQAVFNDGWKVIKSDSIDADFYYSSECKYIHYIGIYPYGTDSTAPFHEKLSAEYRKNLLFMKRTIQDIALFLIVCLAVCALFSLILIIKSGRHRKDDDMHMAYLDKMWVEIRTAIDGGIIFLAAWFAFDNSFWDGNTRTIFRIVIPAAAVVAAAALLDFVLYITRHIKNRDLLKSFMVVWLFLKIILGFFGFLKKNKDKLKSKVKAIKTKYIYVGDVETEVKRKTLIVILLNILVGGFALFLFFAETFTPGLLLVAALFAFDCYILLRGIRFVGAVKRLFRVTSEIRNGDENAKVDYTAIPQAFHKTADDLMGIKDGIKVAVEKAMQNEKMKTELITNVSHDLKTPLTSIINYVDLLQKCNIEDETAQSYLSVLSEKSDRLKHLIEDLVEASKASSGAINVNTVSVSVNEFINQLTGEHSEGLSEKNLTVIVNLPDEDIVVRADSNLLYRVLENLIVNVKKYAMEHTRVYISAQKTGATAKIIVKNISAAPLNMTPEELKSRFVRGDESRSTSGNGLGLSIAENLCSLMKGKLDIFIDGDLFTASVEMPLQ